MMKNNRKSDLNDTLPSDSNERKTTPYCQHSLPLFVFVNGVRFTLDGIDPRTTLAYYLRDTLGLTGTKIACNEGGCGACVVMLSDYVTDIKNGELTYHVRHYSVNACLTPIFSVAWKAVTTVEGIGNHTKMHPIQERLISSHGTQCGFCTPGFVMAMYALLRTNPSPTVEEVDDAIQGNLCRCTGYRPILEAFYSFATAAKEENGKLSSTEMQCCRMDNNCCRLQPNNLCSAQNTVLISKLTSFGNVKPYDSTQELIFPPELKLFHCEGDLNRSFEAKFDDYIWYQPADLDELLDLKMKHPTAKLIAGNTEVGVEVKFRFLDNKVMICTRNVKQLRRITYSEKRGIFIGCGFSFNEVRDILRTYVDFIPDDKALVYNEVIEMLRWFAGNHVRNVATIAGNIVTASPVSDLNPIWMAANASVVLESRSKDGLRSEREVLLNENFFIDYRKVAIRSNEVLTGIWIPFSKPNSFIKAYKQAQRREDDITVVTACFVLEMMENASSRRTTNLRMAFGGMGAKTMLIKQSLPDETRFSEQFHHRMNEVIINELRIPTGAPGGMEEYRQVLALSLFEKFLSFVTTSLKLEVKRLETVTGTNLTDKNGSKFCTRQIYEDVDGSKPQCDPVGRVVMHQSAEKQVLGTALYCDDYHPNDLLHLSLVQSRIAHGIVKMVDISKALQVPGVRGYIDHHDVPNGVLLMGDTPVFVVDKVTYHGQPLGAIIAHSHEAARRAANLVDVRYQPLKPIVSIEDAVANRSYLLEEPMRIRSALLKPNVTDDSSMKNSLTSNEQSVKWPKDIVSGSVRCGGQEHFYFETHTCIVIPGEHNEMEIISSTQCIDGVQEVASLLSGIPRHKINVKVKRIGGGFGGKESVSNLFAAPTIVAALKMRKPIKLVLERNEDMAASGTRHPFRIDYRAGISSSGDLLKLEASLFSNCGHTLDLSASVMARALSHFDNVYRWNDVSLEGRLCRTNLASNTAFRGFGAPQAMFAMETIMLHIAEKYNYNINDLREKNFYGSGDVTPCGIRLDNCNIRRCWSECMELSAYNVRRRSINAFNRDSATIKRGIYVTPTKFSIGFGIKRMNQAGALVSIFTDGSVLISHGGMEMGQGLHTKIIQIAARCLSVQLSKIHIDNTTTQTIPNSSPTAASAGSDFYGLAVKNACECLNERLEPVKQLKPNGTWDEWILEAYNQRIQLFATGFATIHSEEMDFSSGRGAHAHAYSVYGVACSEVEVDCLTGSHKVDHVDIVMDVGNSLNPAIDIGQIEGAFLQGYGWLTIEDVKIGLDGTRQSLGAGTYKIPSPDNAPRHFNVKLLQGSSNKHAVFSSKAVGEPPLFLGASVFFAIRDAVKSYRIQQGLTHYFVFNAPATVERIRMACEDYYVKVVHDRRMAEENGRL
ncbi:hypothetical protein AB6A40_000132 [Gnathostoma spinigerum]|uniref:FAD-binding PCMH-type domain-containing protein n=1 Tax=Gnathostoma spinigerum TaxID=75299 RepID=A0ABD6E9N0_9BILA